MTEQRPEPVVNPTNPIRAWEQRRVPPQLEAQFRLAAELRGLMSELNLTTAPAEVLDELTGLAAQLRALLEPHPRHPRPSFQALTAGGGAGSGETVPGGAETFTHFDHSALMGAANPIAPPMRLSISDGGEVIGRVRFGDLYEGPPGSVHGGFVAAILDEVLGAAQAVTAAPGMTARLEVQYRAPTPLHADLEATGRVERVDGRKIFASGEVRCGDLVTATAEGLFISVDFSRLAPRTDPA